MKIKSLLIILSLVVLANCSSDDPIPVQTGESTSGETGEPPSGETADTCTLTTKLIGNGPNYDDDCTGIQLGNISVFEDGDSVTLTYSITVEDWVLKSTQVYFGPETEIPSNNPGDPVLGQFPYNDIHDPGVTTFTIGPFYIPDTSYVVTAHADAENIISFTTVDSLCDFLPETVDFIMVELGTESYLTIEVLNGGWLDGTYQGWCIDLDDFISSGDIYEDANVYCSNEALPDGIVDHPENIDLINWIINNVELGQASACGGVYTFGDIQKAIWDLIDDEIASTVLLGDWSQCRADEIIANATANGEGYQPECGDYTGIILDAEGVQTVMITVPFTCTISLGVTSAWAYGQNGEYCDPDGAPGISFSDSEYYGGSSWGWYFYNCE